MRYEVQAVKGERDKVVAHYGSFDSSDAAYNRYLKVFRGGARIQVIAHKPSGSVIILSKYCIEE